MVRLYANESAKRLAEVFRRKIGANNQPPPDLHVESGEFTKGSAGALDDVLGG